MKRPPAITTSAERESTLEPQAVRKAEDPTEVTDSMEEQEVCTCMHPFTYPCNKFLIILIAAPSLNAERHNRNGTGWGGFVLAYSTVPKIFSEIGVPTSKEQGANHHDADRTKQVTDAIVVL